MANPTVLVIGGGIIGAAIAERLARDGIAVTVVDRGPMGREASWAAAGLLVPVHPWRYPASLLALDDESFRLWIDVAERIREDTQIDLELRRTGLLALIESDEDDEHAERRIEWTRSRKHRCERVSAATIRDRLSFLQPGPGGALWLEDVAQIRNSRAVPALMESATRRGAQFIPYRNAFSLIVEGGRVVGANVRRVLPPVTTIDDIRREGEPSEIRADFVVLAAGAWSGELLGDRCPPALRTSPCRGQMVLLRAPVIPGFPMVLASGSYLVPRADGRVLAGSTLEPGADTAEVTVDGIGDITAFVRRVAPGLSSMPVERVWAGLRPDTPDHMPCLGPVPGFDGLIAATGHYRSGIMLAPVTAEIVRDFVTGRAARSRRDLAPFAPARAVEAVV